MTSTDIDINAIVYWSPWRRIDTGKGVPMNLRTAEPGADFWQAWRDGKDFLKANGVSCGRNYKDPNKWEVKQWKDISAEELARLNSNVLASQATDTQVEIPVPEGLAYFGYQKAGIAFCRGKHGVLMAEEQGLGKTVEAIGVVNDDETIKKVLVVCPSGLKINWDREIKRWLNRKDMDCWIADSKVFPKASIVIINYDILRKFPAQLGKNFDLVIGDEIHMCKDPKSLRSRSFYAIPARRRLALTGTPIVNRPEEIWPILNWLDPIEFGNKWRFLYKYCGAHKGHFGIETAPSAESLAALHRKLRSSVMLRRLKRDVLKDLPPKTHQILEIDAPEIAELCRSEAQNFEKGYGSRLDALQAALEIAKVSEDPADYTKAAQALSDAITVAFTEMAAVRAATAQAKIPYVIEHLRALIDGGTKVVCFGHHRTMIEAIHAEFGDKSVLHYGGLSQNEKQEAVDRFQREDGVRLFSGSVTASGVGLTLTAASHVVFAESDWRPGIMAQCSDRCHRIGQHDSVSVQYLVIKDSLDCNMVRTCVEKQEVIEQALDNDRENIHFDPAPPRSFKPSAPQETRGHVSPRKAEIEKDAAAMTPEKIRLVHQALRILAQVCDGALKLDDIGFNGCDARIGHDLAMMGSLTPKQASLGSRLCRKYKRQLPSDLYGKLYQ